MPDLTVKLNQWCVVWYKSDTSTRHGQPRVESPVNVRCRWVDNQQQSVTQDATREGYPLSIPVSREVPLGSIIWGPGKIADLPDTPQYYEVVSVSKTPDVKGRHPGYVLSLQKASKSLPEVVS